MAVQCFGKNPGVFHIALGGGFFNEGGMCLNKPIDASEYYNTDRLYVYGNITGYSNPNIRTIWPDGSDDVYTHSRGDSAWIYWNWGGWYGNVIFQLRDGSTVKATRSTYIKPPCPTPYIESIGFSPSSPKVGDKVEFWRTAEGGGEGYYVASRLWNFGDGSTSTVSRPTHTYDTAGTYTVTYTVTNDCGKSTSKQTTVTISADPCAGVVCKDICIGADKYSQKCVGGICVQDALIKSNSSDCPGYDPCKGVMCLAVTECVGLDLYSVGCVDGKCVPKTIIEENSPQCGYVPPDPCKDVVCDNICIGADKYSQGCVTEGVDAGTCVFDQLIEENSPQCGYVPPDPCKDVVCDNICIGADKYSQGCVTEGVDAGTCVFDQLIEENSPDCGYVPPEEKVCDEGAKRGKVTCWDGSIVYKEVCRNNEWVPTVETCPEKPPEEDDDIRDLLDTIGISKEHATSAILIIIVIIILRRLI